MYGSQPVNPAEEFNIGDVIISETPGGRMLVYLITDIKANSWMGDVTAFLTVIDSRFDDELGTTQVLSTSTLRSLYGAIKWQDYVDSLTLPTIRPCTCVTFDLVHFGCKCGAIEQERLNGTK